MRTELQLAYQEFRQATQNFNYAEPGFTDVAIHNLKAAEDKLKELRTKEEASRENQVGNYQINHSISSDRGGNIDFYV